MAGGPKARLVTIEQAEELSQGLTSSCCGVPMVLRIQRQTFDDPPHKLHAGDLAVYAACPRGMHELDRSPVFFLDARIAG